MKRYIFALSTSPTSTLYIILENPQIKDGYIEGKKVGRLHHLDIADNKVFEATEGSHFMAGGAPWTLEEFNGDLI